MIKNLRIKNNEDFILKIPNIYPTDTITAEAFEYKGSSRVLLNFPTSVSSSNIEVSFLNSLLTNINNKSYYIIKANTSIILEGNILRVDSNDNISIPSVVSTSSSVIRLPFIETGDSDPGDLVAIFEENLT